jgi:transglutaminase-like putative cysteine protease
MNMQPYLEETGIIDYSHPDVSKLTKTLANGSTSDVQVARRCFEYVRDKIRHTGDHQDDISTCSASEVLRHKTGWCYAKSHLLAALLRANRIPAGFCYQRLLCSEYKNDVYCLHGLNALYLKEYGWYRVDARGNKEDVDAQFMPPHEKLAFALQSGETELPGILSEPLAVVVDALKTHRTYDAMVNDFPDLRTVED